METSSVHGREGQRFGGAKARRTLDPSCSEVPEHAHAWPVLSLFVLGSYRNRCSLGDMELSAPSAIFYAAGERHSNRVGDNGFEQVEVEFDPAWLGPDFVLPDIPVVRTVGGAAASKLRALTRMWMSCCSDEHRLQCETREFLEHMFRPEPIRRASWIDFVAGEALAIDGARVAALALEIGLHPSWLGHAYRAATGETVPQTVTRRKVEIAARLLRETLIPAAQIATAAGFCDQSHMIRAFRRIIGRTPREVRAERAFFRT